MDRRTFLSEMMTLISTRGGLAKVPVVPPVVGQIPRRTRPEVHIPKLIGLEVVQDAGMIDVTSVDTPFGTRRTIPGLKDTTVEMDIQGLVGFPKDVFDAVINQCGYKFTCTKCFVERMNTRTTVGECIGMNVMIRVCGVVHVARLQDRIEDPLFLRLLPRL